MNINNTQSSQESVYALEPRVYELGYHILSTVDEGNLNNEREALVAIITKFKGTVVSEETPNLIDLSYDMSKIIDNKRNIFSQAYFGWIKFDLAPESIEELTSDVEEVSSILRYLLIKTVKENTIVSDEPYKLAKGSSKDSVEVDSEAVEEKETPTEKTDVSETDTTEKSEKTEETPTAVEESDDLTKIEGIGPKIAEIFEEANIKTFADLSDSKIGDLRDLLEANKLSSHDPKTWSKQATLAKNEKWDKLEKLQDELKGGK